MLNPTQPLSESVPFVWLSSCIPSKLSLSNFKEMFAAKLPLFFKKFDFLDFIYLFLERGEGREKEREKNINMWLPLMWPPLGTWPATQACGLTGNRTGGPLVRSPCSIHWATPARAKLPLNWTIQNFPQINYLGPIQSLGTETWEFPCMCLFKKFKGS